MRACIFFEFLHGEVVVEACESFCSFLGKVIVLHDVCAFWFKLLKTGDFWPNDKQRPRKFDNDDLKKFLAESWLIAVHFQSFMGSGKTRKQGRRVPRELIREET